MALNSDETEAPQWAKDLCFMPDVPATSADAETTERDPLDDPYKAVFAQSAKLWTSGATLTYTFVVDPETGRWQGTPRQQRKVDTIIKEWSIFANITFKRVNDPQQADIRVSFKQGGGSWSYVGTEVRSIAKPKPTMNLGWVNDTTDDILPEDHGTIMHEFGHTLGMKHEHQSPVRGDTLTLIKQKVYEYYKGSPNFWNEDKIDHNIINVLGLNEVSNFSKLDTTSIMMYSMKANLNVQGIEIGRNHNLSDVDRAFMTINYPRLGSNLTLPQGAFTLEKALQIAGVTDRAVIDTILKAKDPATVRSTFTKYIVHKLKGV